MHQLAIPGIIPPPPRVLSSDEKKLALAREKWQEQGGDRLGLCLGRILLAERIGMELTADCSLDDPIYDKIINHLLD